MNRRKVRVLFRVWGQSFRDAEDLRGGRRLQLTRPPGGSGNVSLLAFRVCKFACRLRHESVVADGHPSFPMVSAVRAVARLDSHDSILSCTCNAIFSCYDTVDTFRWVRTRRRSLFAYSHLQCLHELPTVRDGAWDVEFGLGDGVRLARGCTLTVAHGREDGNWHGTTTPSTTQTRRSDMAGRPRIEWSKRCKRHTATRVHREPTR